MATFKLLKLSAPGWEKIFKSEIEVRNELYKLICNLCKEEDDIRANSSLDDMLCTACGLEFDYESTE